MSLLEEFKALNQDEDGYWHDEIADEVKAKEVHHDTLQRTRWGTIEEYVYQRDDEFVRAVYESASGDSNVPYHPEFTAVKPVEKTVIHYVPA